MHPAFAPLHVPERYAADEGAHGAVEAAARERVRGHYDRWNARLDGRDWTLGTGRGRRSLADAYLFAMGRWTGQFGARLDEWSELERFMVRMGEDPGVRAALAVEGLD